MKNDIIGGTKTVKKFEKVVFKKVNFKYPNSQKKVLSDISLSFKKNTKIALVGPSGSGKSSLLSLMIRLFDYQAGDIFINDQKIKNLQLKNLRDKFSLVSQDTVLFDGSIYENIKYNSNSSNKNILNAVKIARVEEFTENLPEKLNTNIGENGIKLSGGQRQRIAIARAIAQKKEVILLDEPTSNLDLKTESELFKNLSKIKNMTLIVVAHRLSTIKNFNEIYFIENGKVLEKGAHKSLIFKKGHYFRLYQKQLRKNA